MSASTQNQALAASLFLHQNVLQVELPWLDGIVRAKESRYLPVVLTPGEVKDALSHLQSEYWLIGSLLYGAGLRLREALTLRVKDVTFEYRQLIVRSGKGARDRSAILPETLVAQLQQHLEAVKARHECAVRNSFAGVELPYALERGYDIRTVRELLGHKDVKTTQIYTHVMRKGANAVQSSLDH